MPKRFITKKQNENEIWQEINSNVKLILKYVMDIARYQLTWEIKKLKADKTYVEALVGMRP